MDKQSTEQKEETLVAMLASFRKEACYHDNFEEDFLRNFHLRYLQPIITQYFIDNKSEIWLLFLIAHSKR